MNESNEEHEQEKWERFYNYSRKSLDDSRSMFKRQDDKTSLLLVFQSILILVILSVLKIEIELFPCSASPLNLSVTLLTFFAFLVDLICIVIMLIGTNFRSANISDYRKKVMRKYWDDHSYIDILKGVAGVSLEQAEENIELFTKHTRFCKTAVILSYILIGLLIIIGFLILLQLLIKGGVYVL